MEPVVDTEEARKQRERVRGTALFLVVLVVYSLVFAMSYYTGETMRAESAGKDVLQEAEARFLIRGYLHNAGADPAAAPDDSEYAREYLEEAIASLEKDLEEEPQNLQTRFALAVCQDEAGEHEAAAWTLDFAPEEIKAKAIFAPLRSLVISPEPDLRLLNDFEVADFIDENPARWLWLASIYMRLGDREEAARQWRAGREEAAPVLSAYTGLMVAWVLVSIIGFGCLISLIFGGKKGAQEAAAPPQEAPQTTDTEHEATKTRRRGEISLALASEGVLLWPVLQLLVSIFPLAILVALSPDSPGLGALMGVIASSAAAGGAVLWVRLRSSPPASIGLRGSPLGLNVRVALAIFLFSPLTILISTLLQNLFGVEPLEPSLLEIASVESVAMRIFIFIGACTLIPLAEEAVFRGLLFRGLSSQWGPLLAAIVSSAIFALIHGDLIAAAPLFVLSLGLAWSVHYTGSIVPAIIAHGLYNFFPLLLLNIMTL